MAEPLIAAYIARQSRDDQAICAVLRAQIEDVLPEAEGKIWHAHPVWFLEGNPIVGFDRLKEAMRLMFWSGQGFVSPGLKATGTFKAAEIRYKSPNNIEIDPLRAWLNEARQVQWDYKTITRRKGRLERIS